MTIDRTSSKFASGPALAGRSLIRTIVAAAAAASLSTACTTQQPEEPPKPMRADVSESESTIEGVPGGVVIRTASIDATVKSIDYDTRSVTLVDDEGGEVAVNVGPEAINFDEIDRGDRVTLVYTEETVVFLRPIGDLPDDGVSAVSARAMEGEKPQGFAAGVIEMTAVVTGVDLESHTAILLFPDGTSREVPVRDDVELSQDQVGQEVVIQKTAAISLSVEGPGGAE